MMHEVMASLSKNAKIFCFLSGEDLLCEIDITGNMDIIFLDVEMMGINGIETFERMQKFSVKIPVIFLTASGDKDDVMSAIKLGAVNYLKKPFLPQELLKRVAKEFEGK